MYIYAIVIFYFLLSENYFQLILVALQLFMKNLFVANVFREVRIHRAALLTFTRTVLKQSNLLSIAYKKYKIRKKSRFVLSYSSFQNNHYVSTTTYESNLSHHILKFNFRIPFNKGVRTNVIIFHTLLGYVSQSRYSLLLPHMKIRLLAAA